MDIIELCSNVIEETVDSKVSEVTDVLFEAVLRNSIDAMIESQRQRPDYVVEPDKIKESLKIIESTQTLDVDVKETSVEERQ